MTTHNDDLFPGVPYRGLAQARTVPNVAIDCIPNEGSVIELSHWPGNRTPARYKADVSTQSCLALALDPDWREFASRPLAVTCDHFDLDGLLSVYVLSVPDTARANAQLLEEAALTGDFDYLTSHRAAKLCLALYAVEDMIAHSPQFRAQSGTHDMTEHLFREALPHVTTALASESYMAEAWMPEYSPNLRHRKGIEAKRQADSNC